MTVMNASCHPAVQEVSSPQAMAKRPVVSVLTITYNHEPFLAECIESVLAQETGFEVEMVIGEDASPDGTRRLCREFQRRYPDRIRLVLPDANLGRHLNFKHTFEACRGTYIALLEGDDYWTDRHKLRKQVELLNSHPEWVMCFHNVRIVGECREGRAPVFYEQPGKPVFTQRDFVERNFVPTCSCLFRSGLARLPAWYYDADRNPYTDWVLHVLNAAHGDIGYSHEIMAAHRSHGGGVWGRTFDGSVAGDIRRMTDRITTLDRLEECMGAEFRGPLRRQRAQDCFHLALSYRERGDWPRVRRSLFQALRADPFAGPPLLRSLLIACVPMLRRT